MTQQDEGKIDARNPRAVDDRVAEAIRTRRSVRGFRPDPVPLASVRELLALASRAPSMTNTQPWRVHVLTGAVLEQLTAACAAAHDRGEQGQAEYDYYPQEWVPPYVDRRREIGWALYGLLGIEKGDRAAAARQHRRNFTFFGAPVGLILTTHRTLRTGSYLDLGMFLQSIMVAARGAGLDTCPQAAFALLHPVIRATLGLPAQEIVVCGMALGWADEAEPANRLVPSRVPVEDFTVFHAAARGTR